MSVWTRKSANKKWHAYNCSNATTELLLTYLFLFLTPSCIDSRFCATEQRNWKRIKSRVADTVYVTEWKKTWRKHIGLPLNILIRVRNVSSPRDMAQQFWILENMSLSVTCKRRQDQENRGLIYDARKLNRTGRVRGLHIACFSCVKACLFPTVPKIKDGSCKRKQDAKNSDDARKQWQFHRCWCYHHYHCKTSQPIGKGIHLLR